VFLRTVPVRHDGGQSLAVSFREIDFDGFVRPPDSHGQVADGILNRMQVSDYIHQDGVSSQIVDFLQPLR
jgi:hypothetical protein